VLVDSELTYIMLDDGTQITVRGFVSVQPKQSYLTDTADESQECQFHQDLEAHLEGLEGILNDSFHEGSKEPIEDAAESPAFFEAIERLAALGDPIAQFDLSIAYSNGEGVKADPEMAEQWLLKSAENGFAPAQYNIGCQERDNNGVNAFHWFMKSAKQNFGPAQFNLGLLYSVTKEHSRAFVWFSLAARNGVETAQANGEKAASFLTDADLEAARLELSAEMIALRQR
jgi:hypothetical protein